MLNYNPDIIFIRAYNGSLIPISKVNLVTIDPNNGKVIQEIPFDFFVQKLIHHNMNNFENARTNWKQIDNYDIMEKING